MPESMASEPMTIACPGAVALKGRRIKDAIEQDLLPELKILIAAMWPVGTKYEVLATLRDDVVSIIANYNPSFAKRKDWTAAYNNPIHGHYDAVRDRYIVCQLEA